MREGNPFPDRQAWLTVVTSASVEILEADPGSGEIRRPTHNLWWVKKYSYVHTQPAPSTPHPNNREQGGWPGKTHFPHSEEKKHGCSHLEQSGTQSGGGGRGAQTSLASPGKKKKKKKKRTIGAVCLITQAGLKLTVYPKMTLNF